MQARAGFEARRRAQVQVQARHSQQHQAEDSRFSQPTPTPTLAAVTTQLRAIETAATRASKRDSRGEYELTTTVTQWPSQTRRPSNNPEESGTVVVSLPPPPPPPKKALSEGTEHLLIAAGSIGATIVLVLIIYGIYMMRKKKLTFKDLIYGPRSARSRPEVQQNWAASGGAQWGGRTEQVNKDLPVTPDQSLTRTGSSSSQQPLTSAAQPPSLTVPLSRGSSNRSQARSFLLDEDEEAARPPPAPPLSSQPNHNRNISDALSSPRFLPLQRPGPTQPPPMPRYGLPDGPGSSHPPTFRQFLLNRRTSGPKVSRFSWTTEQTAPYTPRTPMDRHISVATSARSSVPRFRTVDSWVNQQANRVAVQQLEEVLSRDGNEASTANPTTRTTTTTSPTSGPAPGPGRTGPKHIRTFTTSSEATVFRQHPGTEVVIPRASTVPSEILNSKMLPPSL